jgi:hypothetical protein
MSASSSSTSVAEDRNRQIAAASWILGWIGGPLPAILILLVVRPSGWTRRLVVAAAVFWLLTWGAFYALIYVGSTEDVPFFGLWWMLAVVLALVGTIAGAWAAVRCSRRSGAREPW